MPSGTGGGGVPRWERVRDRAEKWGRLLDVSEVEVRTLKYGIMDAADTPELGVGKLGEVSQDGKDLEFGERAVDDGLRSNRRV